VSLGCKKLQLHHQQSGRNGLKDQARNLSLGINQWLMMIVYAGKWLGNEVLSSYTSLNGRISSTIFDCALFYFLCEHSGNRCDNREKTSLRRWNINCVAFMSAMFSLQVETEYRKSVSLRIFNLLLAYGRGDLPPHGQTDKVWGVDVDRLYFSLFVNEIDSPSPNNAEFPQDAIMAAALFTSKTVKIQENYFIVVRWNQGRTNPTCSNGLISQLLGKLKISRNCLTLCSLTIPSFKYSLRACETMLKRYENRIEEMEDAIACCDEKTIECISELRIIKALFFVLFGDGLPLPYYL
ncbi:LOW QUALITY PROTEIN: hypothetical protein HID58_087191, partial [Brassica napus]